MALLAGNKYYCGADDVPPVVPVFPLTGALLLPGGKLPLNIFEPRYIAMVDAALAGDKMIGMVQPQMGSDCRAANPPLCDVGCVGRIVQFSETGDSRYLICLAGVCRFEISDEVPGDTRFRRCAITTERFAGDLEPKSGEGDVDRAQLLGAFRAFMKKARLDADWDSIERASNCGLVTALSMMSPFGPAEKQALLEAPTMKRRAETLIALAQMSMADRGNRDAPLQ
jgi:Lon protease-like protein